MVDQLAYAAQLIAEANTQWGLFCQGSSSANLTTPYLEARLRPAYDSLNQVRTTLTQRAKTTAYK
jgi:hypothetical protein